MRVIKPMALAVLSRPFEFRRRFHLGVSVVAFLPIGERPALLPETAMWAFLAEAMPADMPLDAGIPKQGTEFLAIATAYAPGGVPVTELRTGIQLGERVKTLRVIGDRMWDGTGASVPAPFAAMPIDWAHAYGGARFAENPSGRGADMAAATARAPVPLPNIVIPSTAEGDYRRAAGFAALDLMWPPRAKLCGTHDETWLKQDFPGFPRDIDWRFFNAAQPDQHVPRPLTGTESFAFENLHPERPLIMSRLPGLAPRLFVTRRDDDKLEEIPLALTTVWFFPDRLRMILIHHGTVAVAEEDAADITHLLAGADTVNTRRPADAYAEVMRLRLDKNQASGAHALNDAQLVPKDWIVPDPAIEAQKKLLMGDGLTLGRMRARMEREHEKMRAEIAASGLDPDKAMPPLPPDEPAPALEEIPAYIEKLMAQAEAEKARLEAELRKAEAELAPMLAGLGQSVEEMRAAREAKPKGPPAFSAAGFRSELAEAAARFRAMGTPMAELEAMLASPEQVAQWFQAEADIRDSYRLCAQHQDRADPQPPARNAEALALLRAPQAARAAYDFHGVDATGPATAGLTFAGQDFSGICFDGAVLDNTDFSSANLEKTVLAHASLRGAHFDGARLAGANLGHANLTGASLRGAELRHAILAGAELCDAVLDGACLEKANLEGARFGGASLRGVAAPGLILMKTSLPEFNAPEGKFDKATFLEVDFSSARLAGASFAGASFIGCTLRGADFSGANLAGAKFVNRCVLDGALFSNANLAGANLREASLAKAWFMQADLQGADFSGAGLAGALLHRVHAAKARFTGADLSGAQLTHGNFMQADLARANLRGADLSHGNFYEANLARARLDRATNRTAMQMTRMRYLPRHEAA
jgi:uncharacterized protein YjbI with pentapeptide repeats